MTHALRIIDANANRAREALRVMEDAARFILNHQPLCAALKSLRHDLAAALASLPPPAAGAMIAWRDAASDVGTAVEGAGEYRRDDARAVAVAAGKRLTEALRSIEEFTKTLVENAAPGAAAIESLRYRAYDLERDLVLALGANRRAGEGRRAWKLCVLLTESLCAGKDWLAVARACIEGGAEMLQLREKSLDSRELLDRARRLVALANEAPHPVTVVINDRPDIALLSGAHGVHLGQTDLTVRDARRIVGSDLFIGVSTESLEQARAARSEGADSCGVGPMFETTTKHKPRRAGPAYLRDYLEESPELPPCLAIGGVNAENARELRAAAGPHPLGVRWGIAVSSAVCAAADPAQACRDILRAAGPPAPNPERERGA